MRVIKILMLLYVSFAIATAEGQTNLVKTITVRSSWGGLGRPSCSSLVIQREGDHYVADGRIIRKEGVREFLNAIEEPRIATPRGTNLGVTSQWLQAHVEEAGKYATFLDYAAGTKQQKELFRSSFTNEQTIQKRLSSLYASFHTDDYPHMSIEVTLNDETTQTVKSDSQHPFMIPWNVSRGGITTETYNADISRALLALLPPEFTNRESLTDEEEYATGLLQELAQQAGSEVETRWKDLGAQDQAGAALTSLKRTYQVRRADVNSYHDLDYGKEWTDGNPHEENLHVDLWHPDLPKNLVVAAILLRRDGRIEGAEKLPEKSGSYERLVLSVGWLKKYWDQHPDEHAWLFYVHGRSFTEKAMQIFSADMKEVGQEDILTKVRAVQDKAALLETGGGDYWIVLPDRSVILWRWQSPKKILLWNSVNFPAHECTKYGTVTGGCSGTTISPDGRIVP